MKGYRLGFYVALIATISVGCGNVQTPHEVDATSDITPDSGLNIRYDIGYVSELTLTPSNPVLFSFLLVVNKGTSPLNTLESSVVSFVADNPGINWRFSKESDATMMLPSGKAAGSLSPVARARVVDSGLVTESIDDPFLNFTMSFPAPPPAGITFNAQAVVRIDGKDATLPFVIHIIASGSPEFNSARRISSQP